MLTTDPSNTWHWSLLYGDISPMDQEPGIVSLLRAQLSVNTEILKYWNTEILLHAGYSIKGYLFDRQGSTAYSCFYEFNVLLKTDI